MVSRPLSQDRGKLYSDSDFRSLGQKSKSHLKVGGKCNSRAQLLHASSYFNISLHKCSPLQGGVTFAKFISEC